MKNSQLSNMLLKVGCFFLLKSLYYQRLFVSLQRENPPSLSTMLKWDGPLLLSSSLVQDICLSRRRSSVRIRLGVLVVIPIVTRLVARSISSIVQEKLNCDRVQVQHIGYGPFVQWIVSEFFTLKGRVQFPHGLLARWRSGISLVSYAKVHRFDSCSRNHFMKGITCQEQQKIFHGQS